MSEGCRRNDSDVRTSSEAPVYSNNAFPLRSEIPPMPMSLARAKTELMLAQERLRAIQKDVDRKMMTYQSLLESMIQSGCIMDKSAATAPMVLSSGGRWTMLGHEALDSGDFHRGAMKRVREANSAASSGQAEVFAPTQKGNSEGRPHDHPAVLNGGERHSSDQSILDVVERAVGPFAFSEEYDLPQVSRKRVRPSFNRSHTRNANVPPTKLNINNTVGNAAGHGGCGNDIHLKTGHGTAAPSKQAEQETNIGEQPPHGMKTNQFIDSTGNERNLPFGKRNPSHQSLEEKEERQLSRTANNDDEGPNNSEKRVVQSVEVDAAHANSKGSHQSMTEESLEPVKPSSSPPNVLPSKKKEVRASSIFTGENAVPEVGIDHQSKPQAFQVHANIVQEERVPYHHSQSQNPGQPNPNNLHIGTGAGYMPSGGNLVAETQAVNMPRNMAAPLDSRNGMLGNNISPEGRELHSLHPYNQSPTNQYGLPPQMVMHNGPQQQQTRRAFPLAGVPLSNHNGPLSSIEMQQLMNLQSRLYGTSNGSYMPPMNSQGPQIPEINNGNSLPYSRLNQAGLYGNPPMSDAHFAHLNGPGHQNYGSNTLPQQLTNNRPFYEEQHIVPNQGGEMKGYMPDTLQGMGYPQESNRFHDLSVSRGPAAALRAVKHVGGGNNGANHLRVPIWQPNGTGSSMPQNNNANNIKNNKQHRENKSFAGRKKDGKSKLNGPVVSSGISPRTVGPIFVANNAKHQSLPGHGPSTSTGKAPSAFGFSDLSFQVPESLQALHENINFSAEDFDNLFEGLPVMDAVPFNKEDTEALPTSNENAKAANRSG